MGESFIIVNLIHSERKIKGKGVTFLSLKICVLALESDEDSDDSNNGQPYIDQFKVGYYYQKLNTQNSKRQLMIYQKSESRSSVVLLQAKYSILNQMIETKLKLVDLQIARFQYRTTYFQSINAVFILILTLILGYCKTELITKRV